MIRADSSPRVRTRAMASLVLAACVLASSGCARPPATSRAVDTNAALAELGLSRATHVLCGPVYVPAALAQARVAMDLMRLSPADQAAIRRSLGHLTWRTAWAPVTGDDRPVGSFCRFYAHGMPCGPWLMAVPARPRRQGAFWEILAWRRSPAGLETAAFGFTPRAPDLTGACAEVTVVFPTGEERFPRF